MGRILTILLTLVYAFSATGASVYLHYCCGEPQQISMQKSIAGDEACPLCPMRQEPKKTDRHHVPVAADCDQTTGYGECNSVKVELKTTSEKHLLSSESCKLTKIYPTSLVAFSIIGLLDTADDYDPLHFEIVGSPPPPAVPLFVQHCTYRI